MNKTLSGFDLHSRAMLAHLSIKSWGGSRLDKQTTLDVAERNGAEANAVRVTKDLVGNTLDGVRASERDIRAMHRELTLPWGDDSTRMLPTRMYVRYKETIEKMGAHHMNVVVPAFVNTYQTVCLPNAERRLGSLFNPKDFPGPEIAEKFGVKLRLLPIPDVADVRVALSHEEVNALRREVEDATRDAIKAASQDALGRAIAPLARLAEALREYGPGKRLAASLFENVADVGELLPDLDLTGNPEVQRVATALKGIGGFDPALMRNDAVARRRLAQMADDVASKLSDIL